jgi:hypothetical protein
MANNNDDLLEQMNKLQNEYYEKSGKNSLFKKAQKMDCAVAIANSCDIEQMLLHTIYILPNTNKMYLDYAIFKMYANPQNYLTITNRILYLFKKCFEDYGNYDVFINLSSLTISGCERHKTILSSIMNESYKYNIEFANALNVFHIYNPPSAMSTIFKMAAPFMNPLIMNKVILYSKQESEVEIRNLFTM